MRQREQFTGLIVEDEWLLRLEMIEELARAGWRLTEAATGEEAMALIEGGIDFLVTDIRLPGRINGWDVAEAGRRRDPQLPVIYVSANPIDPGRRVEGSLFLGKPVDMLQLLHGCDRLVLKH
jgi:CheY-like chemotaxis protein